MVWTYAQCSTTTDQTSMEIDDYSEDHITKKAKTTSQGKLPQHNVNSEEILASQDAMVMDTTSPTSVLDNQNPQTLDEKDFFNFNIQIPSQIITQTNLQSQDMEIETTSNTTIESETNTCPASTYSKIIFGKINTQPIKIKAEKNCSDGKKLKVIN
ncbi:22355_t:CDS:2 [Gigaspora margarita]|uniref:22355_t:CDS:1 n=1 Tax=Gigaspora margarita TaxID=4874 RepID=A0ABN7UIC2_GIGMA|nr:22355_t:CDS:2 [Gigaspora margarita]